MRSYGYWISFLKMLGDAIATVFAFWAAFFLRFYILDRWVPPPAAPELRYYWILCAIVVPVWVGVFYLLRAYRLRYYESREEEFFHVLVGVALASAVVWALVLYYRVFHQRGVPPEEHFEPSRLTFLLFMVLDVPGILVLRAVVRRLAEWLRARGWQIQRAVILGSGTLARSLARRIHEHPEYGIELVGFVDHAPAPSYQGLRHLGTYRDLARILREHRVHTLFVALPMDRLQEAFQIIGQFQHQPLNLHVALDLISLSHLRTSVSDIEGIPVLNINDTPLRGTGVVIKRIMDIVIASVSLVLLAPLFAVIAVAIKLTSRGPVIYRQIRMGLDGRPFVMYKFRTMVEHAEEKTGPVMARPDDRRRTPVGKVLRFLSFDELPQLWNVLKGDMSLVGPRPERPYFVKQFCERYSQYMLRHRVKGGITGWAQVNGWRGDTDFEKRMEYDIYYITHWSVWLDLWILLVTPFRMFRYKGV